MKPGQFKPRKTPLRRTKGFHWNPSTVKAKPEAVDGIQFDSGTEAREYRMLRTLQQSGNIYGLECHPKVVLLQGDAAKGLPTIAFRPDFVFFENGRRVYTDNKSRGIQGNGAFTARELLMFDLWVWFGPAVLRITEWKGDRLCVKKTFVPRNRAEREGLF